MTCHVAHGSSVVMTGYANVADSTDPEPDSGTGGVPPTDGNALLRMDNRGVCENCHNKYRCVLTRPHDARTGRGEGSGRT